ncbi:MAG TPA: hypothetical protein VL995_01225 [Cellvibrio sp.]|nr:hypothetical protein [Cellvibrio sp.]
MSDAENYYRELSLLRRKAWEASEAVEEKLKTFNGAPLISVPEDLQNEYFSLCEAADHAWGAEHIFYQSNKHRAGHR